MITGTSEIGHVSQLHGSFATMFYKYSIFLQQCFTSIQSFCNNVLQVFNLFATMFYKYSIFLQQCFTSIQSFCNTVLQVFNLFATMFHKYSIFLQQCLTSIQSIKPQYTVYMLISPIPNDKFRLLQI